MYKNIYLEEWLLLQAIGVLTFLARKKQNKMFDNILFTLINNKHFFAFFYILISVSSGNIRKLIMAGQATVMM